MHPNWPEWRDQLAAEGHIQALLLDVQHLAPSSRFGASCISSDNSDARHLH
jgi:hypothetical protein